MNTPFRIQTDSNRRYVAFSVRGARRRISRQVCAVILQDMDGRTRGPRALEQAMGLEPMTSTLATLCNSRYATPAKSCAVNATALAVKTGTPIAVDLDTLAARGSVAGSGACVWNRTSVSVLSGRGSPIELHERNSQQ